MSELPYYFETPPAKVLKEFGLYNCANAVLFVTWAFSKCSNETRTVLHDGKLITLAPFEFITGRKKSSSECFLTEDAFRHQLNTLLKAGFLKKTPNSVPNRFNCFAWVISKISKYNPQPNATSTPNSTPTEHPQSRIKKIRNKKNHPSPSFSEVPKLDEIEDLSLNLKNQKIEIHAGIFITQAELDECINARGDIDTVKKIFKEISEWKGRTFEITNYVPTVKIWNLKNKTKATINENEAYAKKLVTTFFEFSKGNGWMCRVYQDKIKDQTGILFESESPYLESFFVSYSDAEFKNKCFKALKDKNMIVVNN